MAFATLEILADKVRLDLARHFDGRPARLAEHLRGLLETLLTAEAPAPLAYLATSGEIRGLRTHLATLTRHLQTASRLPQALCARYKYRSAETQVRRRYGIRPRAWRYFHRLAAELNYSPRLQVPGIAYERFGWHDELEERFVEQEVVVEALALEGLLICALEGYLSPRPSRRKGYEVYGINLGMTREVHHRKSGDGLRITRYVSVMRSHPQLSAESAYGFVSPNPRSLRALLAATTALYPQFEAVGDFHSHPFDDVAQLERSRGWTYTDSDQSSNVELTRALAARGHRVRVAFVAAIARSTKKVRRSRYRGMKNTYQTSLGHCRVILAAYRSLESGRLTASNIRLRLSGTVTW